MKPNWVRGLFLGGLGVLCLAPVGWAAPDDGVPFAVVIASGNRFEKPITAKALRALFMGESKSLGKEKAVPLTVQNKGVQGRFYKKILELDEVAYKSHWIKKVFAEGQRPPAALKSSADVLAFVRNTPNAVGVIDRRDAVAPGGGPLPGIEILSVSD